MPFLEWTIMALPFSAIMLVLVYLLLTRVLCRVSSEPLKSGVAGLKEELKSAGAMGRVGEARGVGVWRDGCDVGGPALARRGLGMALERHVHCHGSGGAVVCDSLGRRVTNAAALLGRHASDALGHLLLFGGGLTLAGQLAEAGVLSAVADALASMPSLSPAWLIAGFVVMSFFSRR